VLLISQLLLKEVFFLNLNLHIGIFNLLTLQVLCRDVHCFVYRYCIKRQVILNFHHHYGPCIRIPVEGLFCLGSPNLNLQFLLITLIVNDCTNCQC
jgi:hypothetical protein